MLSIPLARSQILSNAPPLRFPQKLWKIANECESGAVCWSPHGRSILLRYSLFKEEFMSTKNDFFKTDNISSFVRQLNLYGFRKVYDHTHKQVYKANPDLHEFSNIYFQRDRPDLLDKVTRKLGALRDRNDFLLENQHPSLEEVEHLYDCKDAPKCSIGDENYKPDIRKDEKPAEDKGHGSEDSSTTKTESNVKVSAKTEPKVLQSLGVNAKTPLEPVKKKRGRKPGSKSTTKQAKRIFSNATKYPLPTLRYPEVFSNLIHFDYDDGSVFLRNTSRDVMLSSTLPFQETAEYLELKEIYQRQNDFQQTRTSVLYSSLPVSIPYIRSVNTVDYKKKLFP